MEKMIEITVEQLATLLWIKALDEFEDENLVTLSDKYYNFIENNSVIEEMEVEEFDRNKEILVANKLLKETEKKLEFTKTGKKVIEEVIKAGNENKIIFMKSEKDAFPSYVEIKKFIDDNANVIQTALGIISIGLTIVM